MEGEEDALDETDSDDSTRPVARRRKEASDEDVDGMDCKDRARSREIYHRFRFGSGSESEDLGEAELYVDEESYTEEEKVDDVEVVVELPECDAEQTGLHGDYKRNEEKMSMEPFLVPNFGSFFFHDDRSRDSGDRGHGRRVLSGGGRLWVTKDEPKWSHDKFEEMMQQERQHQEANVMRISKGHSQDNSKNEGHGNVKRTKYRPHGSSYNENRSSKVVKGRGSVRYKSLTSSKNVFPSRKSKKSGQSLETTSTTGKEVLFHTSGLHCVPSASVNCVSASSSSSALLYLNGSTSHPSFIRKKNAKPDEKGSGIVPENERGSQNFLSVPANFPVMQLYDQRHGGIGSSLCTYGFGNSEMSRKEIGPNMASDGRVSIDELELMNHKGWQQKLKPRRYSEMNFDKQIG